MTHSIIPPPELVEEWALFFIDKPDIEVFTTIAQWGADQELEACCKALESWNPRIPPNLRAARRPKSPSLKEQALMALEDGDTGPGASLTSNEVDIIRRALEQLDD